MAYSLNPCTWEAEKKPFNTSIPSKHPRQTFLSAYLFIHTKLGLHVKGVQGPMEKAWASTAGQWLRYLLIVGADKAILLKPKPSLQPLSKLRKTLILHYLVTQVLLQEKRKKSKLLRSLPYNQNAELLSSQGWPKFRTFPSSQLLSAIHLICRKLEARCAISIPMCSPITNWIYIFYMEWFVRFTISSLFHVQIQPEKPS